MNEKLGIICVGSSTYHGQDARTHMLWDEILIIKFLPIDELAARAIMALEEVTILAHKSWNNPVKAGNFIINPFSPVCRAQMFSAAFGTLSANSSKEMQLKGSPPIMM